MNKYNENLERKKAVTETSYLMIYFVGAILRKIVKFEDFFHRGTVFQFISKFGQYNFENKEL